MLKGVQLTLMIGPGVPIPVSKDVLDALTSVEVTTGTKGPSGFQLSFELSTKSPLHTLFLLSGGATPFPIVRVILLATINGNSDVLIDGVMTNHQVSPGSTPSTSTLSVTGEDLTKVMDYLPFDGFPFPAMPMSARVVLMLTKYAFLGIIPKVIPSVLFDVPNPLERIPRQKGTDLNYIRLLAEGVGYVFYLDPGPKPGLSVAYWGPSVRFGTAQPALNVDMDAHTNVESLSFSFNSESKALPVAFIHNQLTKVPIPIPVGDISPLSPPLGLIPPITKRIEPLEATSKLSPIQAAAIAMARASQTSDVVTANGALDVVRYGRLLKARQLVGVRGAGLAFNGLYYVDSVTHQIKRGEYKQSFKLSRNGLVSTVRKVAV